MPTLDEHLSRLYRERQLTSAEVKALLDVRERWRLSLGVEGLLKIVEPLRHQLGVENALGALGDILRAAGGEIALCALNTPYGMTLAMIVRTEVTRWVIDDVAVYLDEQQKRAVHRSMRSQKLAR